MEAGSSVVMETEQQGTKPGASLLFVDDERNILSSLRRLFRPHGYTVHLANSGQEGLEILESESIDLIISDMRMPEMDGAEFLSRAAEKWPDTIRIILTGYADLQSTIDAVNKGKIYSYLGKPWDDNEIVLKVQKALEQKFLEEEKKRLEHVVQKQNEELKSLNSSLEEKVRSRTGELEQTISFLELAEQSLQESYKKTIAVFANLIDLRKGDAQNSHVIAQTCRQVGEKLDLDSHSLDNIEYAALLRDIGKIGLSDSMLTKPVAGMSNSEREQYLKHSVLGQGVLMALEPLHEAANIIRTRHELFDGSGYPDSLIGEQIPIGARILCVVSDYYSLRDGKIFDKKQSHDEAIKYIKENQYKRYDPKVVAAFLGIPAARNEDEVEKVKSIKSDALTPGMVLARDLISDDGILLLSKGFTLDDKVIARVRGFEKTLDETECLTIFVEVDG